MAFRAGIDMTAARASVRWFSAVLESQALELAKTAAYTGGGDLVRLIDGSGTNPRRVDTGETRDGWALAVEQATGKPVGETSAAKYAYGTADTVGKKARVVLVNEAPQAELVEFGAPNMRPGYHIRDAQRRLDDKAAGISDPFIARAWKAA